jgi:hypothetical protein
MRLKKLSIFKNLILLLLSFVFLGMTRLPQGINLKKKLSHTLTQMANVYSQEDLKTFLSFLHKNFENFGEFKYNLEKEFLNKKNLELKFVIDSILKDKNFILVKLHWFKKYMDNYGRLKKKKGKSSFLFKYTPSGYKIFRLEGDNPFFD